MRKNNILTLLVAFILILAFAVVPTVGCGPAVPGGEPIKIGAVGPMDYDFGKLILYGCTIAAEEINAAGGINVGGTKRPVKIVEVNTNEMASITDAVASVEKAITVDKVSCLVGTYRSEAALAYQDKVMENKTIIIGSGSAAPDQNLRVKKDYEKYKYWFRTNLNVVYSAPYFNSHAGFVADILKKELGITELKAVIMADKAAYADPLVPMWSKALPEMGIKVVETYRPSPAQTDANAEIKGIKESGAHIVMQMMTGPSGAVFARQWGELQVPCTLVGVNVLAQSKALWEATGGKAEYIATAVLVPNAEITPKTVPFFKKFNEKYKEFPGHGGMSYDAVLVYKDAVERAGTLNSDALVTALEKTDYAGAAYRIVFGDINTPFPHDVLSNLTKGYASVPLVQWVKGNQICVWPSDVKGAQKYTIPPWMAKFYKK